MVASASSRYPVYVSPDGEKEQLATSPAREVQLKYAGWHLKSEPRKRRNPSGDLSRWQKTTTT